VVPLVVKSLQDFNPQVRVTAVKALNQFDPQNAAAADFVQILIGCITGPAGDTPGVANDAVIELGELHRDPDLAVPALMQTLRSDDIYIRENSAAALGKFGNQAKPAVNALHKALEDPDANVRQQAAMALKRID
jgi:HEAT repeat protein